MNLHAFMDLWENGKATPEMTKKVLHRIIDTVDCEHLMQNLYESGIIDDLLIMETGDEYGSDGMNL